MRIAAHAEAVKRLPRAGKASKTRLIKSVRGKDGRWKGLAVTTQDGMVVTNSVRIGGRNQAPTVRKTWLSFDAPQRVDAAIKRVLKLRAADAPEDNRRRAEALAVIGRSLELGVLRKSDYEWVKLPEPLAEFLIGYTVVLAEAGWTPRHAEIVTASSGAIIWHNPGRFESLLSQQTPKTSSDNFSILVTDAANGAIFAMRPVMEGDEGLPRNAAWTLVVDKRGKDLTWLNPLGRQANAVRQALSGLPDSSILIKTTNYLYFTGQGEFINAASHTRLWNIPGP